jgi:hypothetical protein
MLNREIDDMDSHNNSDVYVNKGVDDGRWVLSRRLQDGLTVLRLRISFGDPGDWHCFRAEVQVGDAAATVVGEFFVAPVKIIPVLERTWDEQEIVPPWNSDDESKFQQIPPQFQVAFAEMVWRWGRVVGAVVPVVADVDADAVLYT